MVYSDMRHPYTVILRNKFVEFRQTVKVKKGQGRSWRFNPNSMTTSSSRSVSEGRVSMDWTIALNSG